jgi:putative peptidoglycan lipid II flippase
MANATTLQQMPIGLISVAISVAALPRLSSYFAARDETAYRQTLGRGLRLVWLLVAPAAVMLWLLAEPVTALLFQRGAFTAADTAQVVAALNIYLIGMVFAAVDFPLNFAFYARNNTLLPALVGVASVVVYTVVAVSLVAPLGYLGLVWADTAKQAAHLGIMLLLLWRVVGRLGMQTISGFAQVGMAAALMGVAAWGGIWAAGQLPLDGQPAALAVILAGGVMGMVVYVLLLLRADLPEARLLVEGIRRRLGR